MTQERNLYAQCGYVLCALIIVISEVTSHIGYSKADQRRWIRHHSDCAGKYQSPIALHSKKSIPISMPAIEMVGYHNLLPGPIKIHNNGHSVSMSIPKDNEKTRLPYIFGGKLLEEYEMEGLHFHWGDKNNRGSEHVLNDIRYPMEMHIIHRNMKYKTVAEAIGHEDGLCVLGFFYQIAEDDSPELVNIVKNISSITNYNDAILLNSTFSLNSLIERVSTERFYTYRGSLTTPPCSEAVRWVLFPDPLPVSVGQMNKFRLLSNGIPHSVLVDNFRTLQPLGNRRVFVRKVNERNTKLDEVNNEIHFSNWDWLY